MLSRAERGRADEGDCRTDLARKEGRRRGAEPCRAECRNSFKVGGTVSASDKRERSESVERATTRQHKLGAIEQLGAYRRRLSLYPDHLQPPAGRTEATVEERLDQFD
jgi:hypothetical protein